MMDVNETPLVGFEVGGGRPWSGWGRAREASPWARTCERGGGLGHGSLAAAPADELGGAPTKDRRSRHHEDFELRDSDEKIKTRGEERNGIDKLPGRQVTFPEQLKVHTEPKILNRLRDKVSRTISSRSEVRGRPATRGVVAVSL